MMDEGIDRVKAIPTELRQNSELQFLAEELCGLFAFLKVPLDRQDC
jgi:hypothetical protein